MTLFQGSIHSGVMKVIKQRVAEAQQAHDADKVILDEQYERDIEAAKQIRDEQKRKSEEHHINSIIGKLI